jgi:transcriptional regulator with XRE-family HTH domain
MNRTAGYGFRENLHWPSMLTMAGLWYCANLNALLTRIGKAIRLRRRALGLSQEELAERCGLSTTYVARLELARKRENPSLHILSSIADALHCDVADLVAKRPTPRLLNKTAHAMQGKLLAESAGKIRTEHLALLIELAEALKVVGKNER